MDSISVTKTESVIEISNQKTYFLIENSISKSLTLVSLVVLREQAIKKMDSVRQSLEQNCTWLLRFILAKITTHNKLICLPLLSFSSSWLLDTHLSLPLLQKTLTIKLWLLESNTSSGNNIRSNLSSNTLKTLRI